MHERQVQLYDTTLRDGMQQEGMSVSVDEKVRIAHRLDDLGIGFIEGGFPASNPKEVEFFRRMEGERLRGAELVAFGMTRRKGATCEDDDHLCVLAEIFTPTVAIVGKTWGLHLTKVLRVSRDENLRMIDESVRFLTAQGKRVVYDAEHFFDAWRDDRGYALRCVTAAAEAGAAVVCLCDTNGASLPPFVSEVVHEVVSALPDVVVGVHVHNDSDCAVADSLVAVEAGARQVQGTVNGYGERCGNANLCSIIPALKLKMGHDVVSDEQLERLTETSHFVADVVNAAVWAHAPYVGRSAFAHKGGMHIAAVERTPQTFEHVDPMKVGNEPRIVVSELSGKGTVVRKALELGLQLESDDPRVATVLKRLKTREHEGYHYEAADASFDLLLRQELAPREPLFRLESFRVIVEKHVDGRAVVEATIKVHVRGERIISTAEGNGPVNALDSALRQAIVSKYPHLADIELVNYKVRILDETKGTGAVTRVLLDASDGDESWGSIGVSENIIEASWEALVDSIEFGMLRGQETVGHNRKESVMCDADEVLEVMATAGEPLSAGAIAERSGMDRRAVDKAMAELKKDGRIESPKRCYWAPKA